MKYGSSNNSATATVDVFLKRRLTGIFMTTYMPTILLNIIGHSAKYFKSMYFDAKISVNLTVSYLKKPAETLIMLSTDLDFDNCSFQINANSCIGNVGNNNYVCWHKPIFTKN